MPILADPKAPTVFSNAKPQAKEYTISDGQGLYMVVMPDGAKLWDFRYRFGGRRRKLAIKGGFPSVGVKKAREDAVLFLGMIARGEDPAEVRKAGKEEKARNDEVERQEQAKADATFEKVAREWYKRASEHLAPSNAKETMRRLEKNIFPWIGPRPIAELRPTDLLAPLRVVEERGARESAHRILGVCGQIFRYAVASALIESDPTRDLRGALARPVETHFAALTKPDDVANLMRAMSSYAGHTATRAALRLAVLTFVRPGNLRMAEWSEFHDLEDPQRAEWRIPGAKMKVKTDRPFVVPLAPQAVALLELARPFSGRAKYVFPSPLSGDRPMSNNTVNTAFRRMGYTRDEMVGHGVRAMARTLCHEALGFAPEVIEEQLAHGKSGPLGGAYDRTTHMPERRRMMRDWADYLDGLEGREK